MPASLRNRLAITPAQDCCFSSLWAGSPPVCFFCAAASAQVMRDSESSVTSKSQKCRCHVVELVIGSTNETPILNSLQWLVGMLILLGVRLLAM